MKAGSPNADIQNIRIDKIVMRLPELFYCTCHWSLVEIKNINIHSFIHIFNNNPNEIYFTPDLFICN